SLIVVDPDPARVESFRRRMRAAGLYGKRVAAHVGDPVTFALPPYLANLIVAEEAGALGIHKNPELVRRAFHTLRPYGGMLCLELTEARRGAFADAVQTMDEKQAQIRQANRLTLLVREGPLPSSDDWTHQYGSAAQTGISRDRLVKAPLGLLWFGGPSHQGILP